MAKTGRKAQHYEHPQTGKPIIGLIRQKDGRWRVLETGERFTESDPIKAIDRFYKLTGSEKEDFDTIGGMIDKDGKTTLKGVARMNGGIRFFDEEQLWAWVATQLRERPKQIAAMTGIEELAYLSDLTAPTVIDLPILLEQIEKHDSTPEVKKLLKTSTEKLFSECGAKDISDFQTEKLVAYRTKLCQQFKPATAGQYMARPKQVLKLAKRNGFDAKAIDSALSKLGVLFPPKGKTTSQPKPLTTEEWVKLLGAAKGNPHWTALLLLGMNLCMYMSEVLSIEWDHLDLAKGTFAAYRKKTGIPRAGVLWAETIEAIKALPKKPKYLFTSNRGTKFSPEGQWKTFDKLRKSVGLAVTFDQIRDSAYTAAMEGAADERAAKVLAGHKFSGLTDQYVLRNPSMTATAVDAVKKKYPPK